MHSRFPDTAPATMQMPSGLLANHAEISISEGRRFDHVFQPPMEGRFFALAAGSAARPALR